MERFYGYRNNGKAHVLARVRGPGQAERLVAGDDGKWESMPNLDRLAYGDADMSWDELTHDQAAAFIKELGAPTSLLASAATASR